MGCYDDGCSLVRFVQNRLGKSLNATPAASTLAQVKFSVDRTHFRNHVGDWCRKHMNPDQNEGIFPHCVIFGRFDERLDESNVFRPRRSQHPSCRAAVQLGEELLTDHVQHGSSTITNLSSIVVSRQKSRKNTRSVIDSVQFRTYNRC